MGKRFQVQRHLSLPYSVRRAFLILNEEGYEPRKMQPYGRTQGRQMFRDGRDPRYRTAKKHSRQQARQALRNK